MEATTWGHAPSPEANRPGELPHSRALDWSLPRLEHLPPTNDAHVVRSKSFELIFVPAIIFLRIDFYSFVLYFLFYTLRNIFFAHFFLYRL